MSAAAFSSRHIGPSENEIAAMTATIGVSSVDDLIDRTVPASIRLAQALNLPPARSEEKALRDLSAIMEANSSVTSYIGLGYSNCYLPAVIRRTILENPGWYTAYTPYQAEIAQGRLEALLNFQTMVCDLTAMDIANASLLDEATAAAEAMAMARGAKGTGSFFVADHCHPRTIEVIQTRAEPLGIPVIVGPVTELPSSGLFGALVQYPGTDGTILPLGPIIERIHAAGGLAIVSADLLALTLIKPPGEVGADIVVGSAQRFGVPPGGGGPHAAYLATRDAHKRRMPGRLVGVSKDAAGNPALRLTLQTREQHIRRDKATSNICTAQVLLAVIASMYAVYHGPEGLKRIAASIHGKTSDLAASLKKAGFQVQEGPWFDTIRVGVPAGNAAAVLSSAVEKGFNFRKWDDQTIIIALDETVEEITPLLHALGVDQETKAESYGYGAELARESAFLTHPVFNTAHTETELLRYIKRLEAKDLSLTTSMIPLGSCTMKLNAAAEMYPVTWPKVSAPHPFAPIEQLAGYHEMAKQLELWLGEITGLPAVSLQPNAGSQGEYAGLLAIRGYHLSRSDTQRNVCLIPVSAHGTNPASAAMTGLKVVGVACDELGNIDMNDLDARIAAHRENLAGIMITYPSTHGVFEETIKAICEKVHAAGGLVYMDGANMNAQVGLCRPGDIGADVCHLNLHKTFCIPHGGGGPGVGPVCATQSLAPFMPTRAVAPDENGVPVSQAPYGSASILVIPWMYIAMMGADGLTEATKIAILNANYIATRLKKYFSILYTGTTGFVAHECIVDFREWKQRSGIEVEDVAKRLMDYGFHAPTMSWPVAGTLMIEPTESEDKAELDRFCDALIAIHDELVAIEEGRLDRVDNPLKNAPHTAQMVTSDEWAHPYLRAQAAYPLPWLRSSKFWPASARIDNVYGDRNIFCSCPPLDLAATE